MTIATAPTDTKSKILALRQDALDDLLSRWDHWLHPVKVGRGYGSTSSGGELYRASRQYDDANGVLDDEIEHRTMCGVQACVERLSAEHRIAIHTEARNVRLGVSVWRSPRLPQDPDAARAVMREARLRLIVLLVADGLVD